MKTQPILINEVLIRQLKPSFKMTRKIIESCPKAIWAQRNINPPIWQQVYHMLYGADYWFSKTKDSFQPPEFNGDVNSVLGEESAGFIDQVDMLGYLDYVSQKVVDFVGEMDGDKVTQPSILYDKWTNLDVFMEQVRHVQHHLGYLNRVLLKCKIKPVEWEFYEE
jgi:hypothetical protein